MNDLSEQKNVSNYSCQSDEFECCLLSYSIMNGNNGYHSVRIIKDVLFNIKLCPILEEIDKNACSSIINNIGPNWVDDMCVPIKYLMAELRT